MTPKPAKGIVAWVLRSTGFAGVALAPFGIYILPSHLLSAVENIKKGNKYAV